MSKWLENWSVSLNIYCENAKLINIDIAWRRKNVRYISLLVLNSRQEKCTSCGADTQNGASGGRGEKHRSNSGSHRGSCRCRVGWEAGHSSEAALVTTGNPSPWSHPATSMPHLHRASHQSTSATVHLYSRAILLLWLVPFVLGLAIILRKMYTWKRHGDGILMDHVVVVQ